MPHLYLISARAGDQVPGTDLALAPAIAALGTPAVQEWMTEQGYGLDDPAECMYLASEPAPDGYPSRRITVTPAELAAWQAAADEQDDLDAAARDERDGYEPALAGLREYRDISSRRDEIVRAAHAAAININRIHRESGISRPTIYGILGTQAGEETGEAS